MAKYKEGHEHDHVRDQTRAYADADDLPNARSVYIGASARQELYTGQGAGGIEQFCSAADEARYLVDRIVFGCVAVALMGLGVCLIFRPAWVAGCSRDSDDPRPVTSSEAWLMRVAGLVMVLGSGYSLYAILTGMPGAEFGAP